MPHSAPRPMPRHTASRSREAPTACRCPACCCLRVVRRHGIVDAGLRRATWRHASQQHGGWAGGAADAAAAARLPCALSHGARRVAQHAAGRSAACAELGCTAASALLSALELPCTLRTRRARAANLPSRFASCLRNIHLRFRPPSELTKVLVLYAVLSQALLCPVSSPRSRGPRPRAGCALGFLFALSPRAATLLSAHLPLTTHHP